MSPQRSVLRRTVLMMFISLVVLLPLAIQPTKSASATTPGVYITLGDSIAAGIGSSLLRTRGNAAIVADWLAVHASAPVQHENLAVPGETAASFIDAGQLESFRATVATTRTAGVPIAGVSVTLGGNELLSLQSNGLSDRQDGLDTFRGRYAEALSVVRSEIGPETPLIVTTYYDLSEGDATAPNSDAWWIEQFNAVIRTVADEQGATVADVASRFDGQIAELTHYPFDVHPNNAGHLAIAQTIWAALGVDREAPSISVESGTETTRQTPTIRFSVNDNVGVRSVAVTGEDVSIHGPRLINENTHAVLLDLTVTDRDEVALTIEISDDAGNTTRENVIVRVTAVSRDENQ